MLFRGLYLFDIGEGFDFLLDCEYSPNCLCVS